MKKQKKNSQKGARTAFILIGAFLLLWNAAMLSLYLFGDVTDAYNITVSRIGAKGVADPNKKYRFDISYNYTVEGVEYDGLDIGVRGPRLGPKYDKTVHYFPFAPKISSLCAEDAASFGMVLTSAFALGMILLAAIPSKKERQKRAAVKNGVSPVALEQPRTMAWLMENTQGYDDPLEEYYQNGWDQNDPSWQCACGKWNIGNFCKSCGGPRQ